jgi:hypothetical protein
MFMNDDLATESRDRLFNIFVSPYLKETTLQHSAQLSEVIFMYVIDLQEDTMTNSVLSYEELLTKADVADRMTANISTLLTSEWEEESVKVCMLMYGPRGTPCLSAYKFTKLEVLGEEPVLVGECPEKVSTNVWFSKKSLISRFEATQQYFQALEENKDPECIKVVILKSDKEISVTTLPFKEMKFMYLTYLMPKSEYKLLEKAFQQDHRLILFITENYYIRYPLIAHYNGGWTYE